MSGTIDRDHVRPPGPQVAGDDVGAVAERLDRSSTVARVARPDQPLARQHMGDRGGADAGDRVATWAMVTRAGPRGGLVSASDIDVASSSPCRG